MEITSFCKRNLDPEIPEASRHFSHLHKARQGWDLDTERADSLAQRDLCFVVLQNLVGDNKMMSGQTSPFIVKRFVHNTDKKCQKKYATRNLPASYVQPALARSSRRGVNTGPKRQEIECTDVKPMSHQSQDSLQVGETAETEL